MRNLSILLIGMVGQKIVAQFGSKIVARYCMYLAQKWWYFHKCKKASVSQEEILQRYVDKSAFTEREKQ